MEVLNKLKNTVSTTVSQLSGVLPGNPVTREFDATRQIGSAGPGLLWKIYDGCKKSTKQEVAIFVLEKKQLERYARRDRELILETLRKGVAQLTRLRHPKILTVQHPLEESRESLAFATEPVFASLANAIGHHDNMPSPVPPEIQDYNLYEVEIKYGILQLCEALTFLHGDVRMLHRNVCPESVIISKSGSWKLSGFEFCLGSKSPPDQPPMWPFHEWEGDIHPHGQPALGYLAPEYALTLSCDAASDMFSLGSLVYSVFNGGKSLLGNGNTYSSFKKHACELKNLSVNQLGGVPSEVREHVKLLLNATPELRPDAHQFSKVPFFDDVGAKALEYLDSLFQWDNLQKSQFYKGLPQVISKMPKRVNLYRIIPCLAKEFVNPEMVPFVLPSVLLIAEDATKDEFCRVILPELRPLFKMQEPVQVLLIFMQKMELLLSKTPAEDIKSHVLPMVYRALESDTHQIQELCLNVIPTFANQVDYPSMKNALLPRVKKICLTTPYLSVRVNCLVCLGKLLEHLDKWLVLDDVLPMLPEIPSREPAVLMGILGIYKLTMTHKKLGITKDVMAAKVIPFLMPLTIESGLNLSQFNAIIAVVKDMVNRVEVDHRSKLEQLNNMQHEQRSNLELSKVKMADKSELISGITAKPLSDSDKMFQGLGLGGYIKEQDVSKTADDILPQSTQTSSSAAAASSNKQGLSMEAKERLAREQDRQQFMKKQSPVRPTTATPTSGITTSGTATSRDLTNTLMQSNLQNMSRVGATTRGAAPNYNVSLSPTAPSGPVTSAFGGAVPMSTTGVQMSSGVVGYQSMGLSAIGSSPGMTSYPSSGSAYQHQPISNGGGMSTPLANWNMGGCVAQPIMSPGSNAFAQSQQQQQQQQRKPDLTSFDALFPMSGPASSQGAKVPMNQMSSQRFASPTQVSPAMFGGGALPSALPVGPTTNIIPAQASISALRFPAPPGYTSVATAAPHTNATSELSDLLG